MASEIALKCLALKLSGEIKTNFQFWKTFPNEEKLKNAKIDVNNASKMLKNCNFDIICSFDENFPILPKQLKLSEKPFLLAYRGDVSLLKNSNKVAVIGVLTPTESIEKREDFLVETLVKNDAVIVSGLARGCDSVAHKKTLELGGKTIAILPTTLDNIYPKENETLVDEIVANGGLILSEYIDEPKSKSERIRRFIERDRLQAMFSESVVLIASYRHGEGDSGSRHAMQKAKEYGKKRYVMFNKNTDSGNAMFGLNEDLTISSNVPILTRKNIKDLFQKIIIVDLDDTLVSSTELNNDAYNFALEKHGLARIECVGRITRENLKFMGKQTLNEIVSDKQDYFTEKWLKYRILVNDSLVEILKRNGRNGNFLWTSADENRAKEMLKQLNLENLFSKLIFDKKDDLESSLKLIKKETKSSNFVIYENNFEFLSCFSEYSTEMTDGYFKTYKFEINLKD